MKTKNETYFREQSKLPAPKGFVCIGPGSRNDPLENYFKSKDLWSVNCYEFLANLNGDSIEWTYCVRVRVWEEKFGPLNKEINMSKTKTLPTQFYVRTPSLELWNLVQTRLFELGFSWFRSQDLKPFPKGYGKEYCISVNFDLKDDPEDGGLGYSLFAFYKSSSMEEIQIADLFLAEIPKKEIVINYLPWNIIIQGDKCEVGCQKNISTGELVSFVNQLNQPDFGGSHKFYGFRVDLGRKGVSVEGKMITWELWDRFVKELNEIDKKNSKEKG